MNNVTHIHFSFTIIHYVKIILAYVLFKKITYKIVKYVSNLRIKIEHHRDQIFIHVRMSRRKRG